MSDWARLNTMFQNGVYNYSIEAIVCLEDKIIDEVLFKETSEDGNDEIRELTMSLAYEDIIQINRMFNDLVAFLDYHGIKSSEKVMAEVFARVRDKLEQS